MKTTSEDKVVELSKPDAIVDLQDNPDEADAQSDSDTLEARQEKLDELISINKKKLDELKAHFDTLEVAGKA